MSSAKTPSHWHKDEFTVSTSQDLLQLNVITKAFDSDYMYWTKSLPEEDMKALLANSLCFGIYITPKSTSDTTSNSHLSHQWMHDFFVLKLPQTNQSQHRLDLAVSLPIMYL